MYLSLKCTFQNFHQELLATGIFVINDNVNFTISLNDVLCENENIDSFLKDPDSFYEVCTEVLNKHAPPKKKYVRGNNKPFMNKAISKAIMLRTKLRNKLLKYPTTANGSSYSKQRNFCLSLLRKEKKKYFANLNIKNITDNKIFWQIIKPFLSEKTKSREKITLIENEKLVSYNTEVANYLNNFFSNIVKNLEIPKY